MRCTPRLLLALLLLQLWGCSFDRKMSVRCNGKCDIEVENSGVLDTGKENRK
jgi:hypothetical protein